MLGTLLDRARAEPAVLTGEDCLYFSCLANGAAGGILASAHLATRTFCEVADAVAADAGPMPLKYCLWRLGLIGSPSADCP